MPNALDEQSIHSDPIVQFRRWYESASANVPLHSAMALATVSDEGVPSMRMVLLKGVDEEGFVFYTNYVSRKGRELARNPRAALLFHWQVMERQVRIEGMVERVSDAESDAYFRTRPRESQISAIASPQSEYIASREDLERMHGEIEKKFGKGEIPRPAHWGGYRLKPIRIEFWQGREARLHDRIVYERQSGGKWIMSRLAP